MGNYKRKANYHSSRSCGLCKPHKRLGNSKQRQKVKHMLPKEDGEASVVVIPQYADPEV